MHTELCLDQGHIILGNLRNSQNTFTLVSLQKGLGGIWGGSGQRGLEDERGQTNSFKQESSVESGVQR